MSKVYFTSDLHLGHDNIHKYRKGFSSAQEHHEIVFDNLASTVNRTDKVFMLGDIAFSLEWLERIKTLPFRKSLILGNHDIEGKIHIKDLVNVYDDISALTIYKNFWLSHCPIHNKELRGRAGNIHGHLHNKLIEDDKYINVCLEHTELKPIQFRDILDIHGQ